MSNRLIDILEDDKKMTDLNKFISKHDRQPKTKKTTKPTEKIRSTY